MGGLPEEISPEPSCVTDQDLVAIQAKYSFLREAGYGKFDTIHRADLRISDISNLLGSDWVKLAQTLDIDDQDINLIISEYPDNVGQQAMVMLRLWLNTEGNKATGNALEKALKKCDREDIVDKCMFNVKMVTDNDEAEMAQNELLDADKGTLIQETKAFREENNVSSKSLMRDYSIDVNVDENDYRDTNYGASDRLGEIKEEGVRGVRDFLNQEEDVSVYEREEQKYVAEEKEFASSSYQEESVHLDNNIIIQKSENKSDYLHEEMKKMTVEESKTVNYSAGDQIFEMKTESKMEEQYEDREQFNTEKSETKQMQVTENEDGTVLILTDSRKETKEEFAAESHKSKHYEEAETVRGDNTIQVKESNFQSEKHEHEGFEEHHIETVQQTVETSSDKGSVTTSSLGRRAPLTQTPSQSPRGHLPPKCPPDPSPRPPGSPLITPILILSDSQVLQLVSPSMRRRRMRMTSVLS